MPDFNYYYSNCPYVTRRPCLNYFLLPVEGNHAGFQIEAVRIDNGELIEFNPVLVVMLNATETPFHAFRTPGYLHALSIGTGPDRDIIPYEVRTIKDSDFTAAKVETAFKIGPIAVY